MQVENATLTFDEVVARDSAGTVVLGIDRAFARRFYTDMSLATIREHTGEAPYAEKSCVMTCFVGAPVLLLAASIRSIQVFGWWSGPILPVLIIGWIVYKATSARAGVTLTAVSAVIAVVAALFVFNLLGQRTIWGVLVLYSAALWSARSVYSASTLFLRSLLLRNARAFNWLRNDIIVRTVQ